MPALRDIDPRYQRAIARLASGLRRRLSDRLAEASNPDLVAEFRRRADDYRCWRRMEEAPARVTRIAERLGAGDEDGARSMGLLQSELLGALERAHRDALAGGVPNPARTPHR